MSRTDDALVRFVPFRKAAFLPHPCCQACRLRRCLGLSGIARTKISESYVPGVGRALATCIEDAVARPSA